jgi:hypothetical protein
MTEIPIITGLNDGVIYLRVSSKEEKYDLQIKELDIKIVKR